MKGDKIMKGLIIAVILSIVAILLGGFLLCFPQIIPFAITLIVLGGLGFISFGILAIATACRYFD
jgi:polyferredoxin